MPRKPKLKIVKPKKPKGFQKNNKLTPPRAKGITQYDREQLILKKIDNVTVVNYITLNSHLTREQLEYRITKEKPSAIEGMLIRGLLRAYDTGDIHQMNFYLDRLVGKVATTLKHEVANPFKDVPTEELIKQKEQLAVIGRRTMDLYEQTSERFQAQEKLVNGSTEQTITEPVDSRDNVEQGDTTPRSEG